MNRLIGIGLGVLSSPKRSVRFLRYGIAALLLQACWLSAAYADLGSTSKPTVSGVPAGSLGTPPPANKEEEAPGVPVLEGGPAKRVDVKPARAGTVTAVPAEGIDVQQRPANTPLQDAIDDARRNAKLKLAVRSGTQEHESWETRLTLHEPTALQFRWSSVPALGEVMWIVSSTSASAFAAYANGDLKQSNYVIRKGLTNKSRFSIDFDESLIAASPHKDFWIHVLVVDGNGNPQYAGNPMSPTTRSEDVRIQFKPPPHSNKVMGACSSDSDCKNGDICDLGMCARRISDIPRVDRCITYKEIERVDNTMHDCAPYICAGPKTRYPPKGTPGAICSVACSSPGGCAVGASCKQFQCVLK